MAAASQAGAQPGARLDASANTSLHARSDASTASATTTESPPGVSAQSPVALQASDTIPAAETSAPIALVATSETSRSIAPGYDVTYDFEVSNLSSDAALFDLTTSDTAGFVTAARDASGSAIATVALAAHESTGVQLAITVPTNANVGAPDTGYLSASFDASPEIAVQARVHARVADPLVLSPDNSSTASPGSSVDFAHQLTNSLPVTSTVVLSATDLMGWPVAFFAEDGVTPVTTLTVAPFGGTENIIARLAISADATRGSADTVMVRATDGTNTAGAIDDVFVRRLETYAGADDTTPCEAFHLGDTVYARAGGLEASSQVCFVWLAPDGSVAQTSAVIDVDASGTAADSYATRPLDPAGRWTVELHADDENGPLIEAHDFSVTYRGTITSLSANDGRDPDSMIVVSSAVANGSQQPIAGSVQDYLMWWDANNNGVFDLGDTYIDETGTPEPYSPDAVSHEATVSSIEPSGTWVDTTPWAVANEDFPNQGTYNVTATWRDADGAVIDTRTAQFFAVPTLGWPPLLLLVGVVGGLAWRTWPRPEVRSCT